MEYYFTKLGEIYVGEKTSIPLLPNHKVIVHISDWKEFEKLKSSELTYERLNQIGWVVHKDSIIGSLTHDQLPEKKINPWGRGWRSNFNRKFMFIFGAGASANCVYEDEQEQFRSDLYRPPLGNELFQKKFKPIYSRYPGVTQALNYLRDKDSDVEALFENDWNDIEQSGNEGLIYRHINIQYYLRELLSMVTANTINNYESNLYARFSEKLQRIYSRMSLKPHFVFVSFNQDTLLEYFLSSYFNISFSNLNDYVNFDQQPFSLFKPHGSWNWGWKFAPDFYSKNIRQGTISDWLFSSKADFFRLYYELLGTYENMVDWHSWGVEGEINQHKKCKFTVNKEMLCLIDQDDFQNSFPALLLPYRDKDEFTMPLSQYLDLKSYLSSNIETLIIVGWKGNEAAFNRLLQQHGNGIKKIIIADPNPKLVEQNLKDVFAKKKLIKILYRDFEDFVNNGLEKELN